MKKIRKALFIWLVLISFPFLCWLLMQIVEWGLIPLFAESIYFLPISWVGMPLFEYTSDIGGYITTNEGRVFGVIVYTVLYWLVYIVIKSTIFKGRA